MTIGMILDAPFPPDPRVENEAVSLVQAGYQVCLFCLTYGDEPAEEIHEGIRICRYRTDKLEYKLSALAYTLPFYTNSMAKKIKEFVFLHDIDVLHVHDMRIAGAAFKAIQNKKMPFVLDLHENRPEIMKLYPHLQKFPGKYLIQPSVWKKQERFFVEKASHTIVVTEEAKNELLNRCTVLEKSIVVVPNTVRESFYKEAISTTEVLEKYKNKFVLLYLGHTGLRRGLLTAIESVSDLKNTISNMKLVIVGKSSSDALLKKKVQELGVDNDVDFVGWEDVSLFPSYIQASTICISPLHRNVHHDTTYANKIFQYMSLGKPLLVSDATAQKTIVEKSKSGLIHIEKDSQDFTDKVLKLAFDENLRSQMGANGKAFVETEFSWEQTSKNLVHLYDNLNR